MFDLILELPVVEIDQITYEILFRLCSVILCLRDQERRQSGLVVIVEPATRLHLTARLTWISMMRPPRKIGLPAPEAEQPYCTERI